MMSSPVHVVPLAERPDLVALVAAWQFSEWGRLYPGQTLAMRERRLLETLDTDRLPVTFVALDASGGAAGTAALDLDDLEGDPRNPWLASVYVPPERRRAGIASALVRAVERAAVGFGHRKLYLFTATVPRLYAGLGWRPVEAREYQGERITVMERDL